MKLKSGKIVSLVASGIKPPQKRPKALATQSAARLCRAAAEAGRQKMAPAPQGVLSAGRQKEKRNQPRHCRDVIVDVNCGLDKVLGVQTCLPHLLECPAFILFGQDSKLSMSLWCNIVSNGSNETLQKNAQKEA